MSKQEELDELIFKLVKSDTSSLPRSDSASTPLEDLRRVVKQMWESQVIGYYDAAYRQELIKRYDTA